MCFSLRCRLLILKNIQSISASTQETRPLMENFTKNSSICIKLLCISRKKKSFIMSPYFIKRVSFNFLDPFLFFSSVQSVCPYVCFCACFCLFFLSFYAFFSLSFGFFLSLSIVVKWTVCPCLPMEHIGGVVVSVIQTLESMLQSHILIYTKMY